MKRRDNIKRMKEMMEEMRKRKKPSPNKKASKKPKKKESKPDTDLSDDGKVDEKDVGVVIKQIRKKKIVAKD